MADRTNLFKATLKTVKTQQKAQGIPVAPDKSILGSVKRKSDFTVKAHDMVKNITKMRDFLLENRKAYINASSHLCHSGPRMSEAERDQIDSDAETFIKTCSETIRLFKQDAAAKKLVSQVREHHNGVFALIDAYLKAVCSLYSEQRAVRVKRVVDHKRLARLEPERKPHENNLKRSEVTKSDTVMQKLSEGNKEKLSQTSASQPILSVDSEKNSEYHEDSGLSAEEIQMFEMENKQLFQDMNGMIDEVRQVERKVVEIARLQEILADKVLEQEPEIDQVAETIVGTTENIKEANEEIREAMKNNAGLRVWILFFLIVLTFSLLFLDWYNP